MFGSVTRKNVCKPLAPSTRAASSSSRARSPPSPGSSRGRRTGTRRRSSPARCPGTAKMIWMSCSASHGPKQPCRPNSSTNTSPEMTGETANGRSISVISSCLPRKVELGDRPAGDRRRRRRFTGTAIAAASSVSRSAASASGSRMAVDVGADAVARTPRRTRRPAARRGTARGTRAPTAVSGQRTHAGSVSRRARSRVLRDVRMDVCRPCQPRQPPASLQPCSALIDEQQRRTTASSITSAIAVAPGVVELLELGDDQQRRDLRPHRHVAGDEDDRPVLADRARERQREAGEPRRDTDTAGSRARAPASGVAPRLVAASSISTSRSSITGCSVRTTNGRPMKISAIVMPSGVNATLMPCGSSGCAEPAVRRVERRQRDAGDRRRQRERQVDQRVDDAAARESRSGRAPRRRATRRPR